MLDAIAGAGVVLVSDYGRGRRRRPRRARRADRGRGARPAGLGPAPPRRPTRARRELVTPNLAEARGYVAKLGYSRNLTTGPAPPPTPPRRCAERWGVDAVAVTARRRGAVLRGATGTSVVPAEPARGGDPCGAGDRFAATAAARLGDGRRRSTRRSPPPSPRPPTSWPPGGAGALGDLPDRTTTETPADVVAAARDARRDAWSPPAAASTSCTPGTPAPSPRRGVSAGDDGVLVVCLNSDASVRRLKGPDRPVVAEADRAEMLRALTAVDAVEVFDEDDPRAVLERLRPDVWVKGGDYATDELPETPLVRGWGGEVVAVPYHAGRSSTRLLARLEPEPVPTGGTP